MYVIITVNLSQDARTKYTIDRINGFRQGMERQKQSERIVDRVREDKVTGLTPFGGVTDLYSLFNTVKGE